MTVRSLPALLLPALLPAALIAGCAGDGTTSMGKTVGETPSLIVDSEMIGDKGQVLGTARVSQEREGTRIVLNINGLPPGSYGVHLHEVGRCDWPGFTSAGGHFNPGQRQHGHMNPAGEHAGDLPNLVVGEDRRGTLDAVRPGLRMVDGDAALLNIDGASLMLHAAPDDYKTDPSGNSGARIGCSVLAWQRQRA